MAPPVAAVAIAVGASVAIAVGASVAAGAVAVGFCAAPPAQAAKTVAIKTLITKSLDRNMVSSPELVVSSRRLWVRRCEADIALASAIGNPQSAPESVL